MTTLNLEVGTTLRYKPYKNQIYEIIALEAVVDRYGDRPTQIESYVGLVRRKGPENTEDILPFNYFKCDLFTNFTVVCFAEDRKLRRLQSLLHQYTHFELLDEFKETLLDLEL